MNILVVAPLPPPLTGNSLPVQVLCEQLRPEHNLEIVNLSKRQNRAGFDTLGRIREIVHALQAVRARRSHFDVMYLALAESRMGNLRDLSIAWLCRRRLDRLVGHLFGGAGMHLLLSRPGMRRAANRWALSRMGAIVVEGGTQKATFAIAAPEERIHVVSNFALDELFVAPAEIRAKFSGDDKLRVLFLSNMLPGKGHFELLEAYRRLDPEFRRRISLEFAGKLVTPRDERLFFARCADLPEVVYHGPVFGEKKRALLAAAHLFCLPTYYPYEGQPFSLLESYAAGACVVTTGHSGINDVFTHLVNGFQVESRSVSSLAAVLRHAVNAGPELVEIGLRNRTIAGERYTAARFVQSLTDVLRQVGGLQLVSVPWQDSTSREC